MNLEKMTKVQLLDLIKEQKHLAEAVEFKDAEIVRLNSKIEQAEKTVRELNVKLQEQKHLSAAVESKDLEITSLKNQMAREIEKEKLAVGSSAGKVASLQDEIKRLSSDLELYKEAAKNTSELKEKHAKAVYLLEQYILAFRSLMQANRGILDNAIALDNLLNEKIKE